MIASQIHHLHTYSEVRGENISVVLDPELIWHPDSKINKLSKWERKPETMGSLVSLWASVPSGGREMGGLAGTETGLPAGTGEQGQQMATPPFSCLSLILLPFTPAPIPEVKPVCLTDKSCLKLSASPRLPTSGSGQAVLLLPE